MLGESNNSVSLHESAIFFCGDIGQPDYSACACAIASADQFELEGQRGDRDFMAGLGAIFSPGIVAFAGCAKRLAAGWPIGGGGE